MPAAIVKTHFLSSEISFSLLPFLIPCWSYLHCLTWCVLKKMSPLERTCSWSCSGFWGASSAVYMQKDFNKLVCPQLQTKMCKGNLKPQVTASVLPTYSYLEVLLSHKVQKRDFSWACVVAPGSSGPSDHMQCGWLLKPPVVPDSGSPLWQREPQQCGVSRSFYDKTWIQRGQFTLTLYAIYTIHTVYTCINMRVCTYSEVFYNAIYTKFHLIFFCLEASLLVSQECRHWTA